MEGQKESSELEWIEGQVEYLKSASYAVKKVGKNLDTIASYIRSTKKSEEDLQAALLALKEIDGNGDINSNEIVTIMHNVNNAWNNAKMALESAWKEKGIEKEVNLDQGGSIYSE